MKFLDPFGGFETFDASDYAESIAHRLEANLFKYCVIREKKPKKDSWHVLKVDRTLIRKLKVKKVQVEIMNLLGLSGRSGAELRIVKRDPTFKSLDPNLLSSKIPIVFLDPLGEPWALHAGLPDETLAEDPLNARLGMLVPDSELPPPVPPDSSAVLPPTATPGSLFAKTFSTDGDEVEPEQVVEIAVKIDSVPPKGQSAEFKPVFPAGVEEIAIYVQLTSTEFSKPDGETWTKACVVDRELKCTNGELLFKVRAIGDRPNYSLTVSLSAANTVLEALRLTLGRKGAANAAALASPPPGPVTLPAKPGAQMRISALEAGRKGLFNITLFEGNKNVGNEMSCDLSGLLEKMESMSAEEVGAGLWIALSDDMQKFLDRPQTQEKTLLLVGKGSLAPFELLRMPRNGKSDVLGIWNPLTRWVPDHPMPDTASLKVLHAACVRPVYKNKGDALPSAEKEEKYMRTLFKEKLSVASKDSEVKRILNGESVSLFHFAGHADGNPAQLALEDAKLTPTGFSESSAMRQGRPLFFLNGCRGGLSTTDVPAMLGDFARSMLVHKCTAFVAPMVKVESEAASQAAEIFYDALSTDTVGEAVRKVRAKALDGAISDDRKKSFLSYTAFAAPDLKLEL